MPVPLFVLSFRGMCWCFVNRQCKYSNIFLNNKIIYSKNDHRTVPWSQCIHYTDDGRRDFHQGGLWRNPWRATSALVARGYDNQGWISIQNEYKYDIWLICYKRGIRGVQRNGIMTIFAVAIKQREDCLCQRKKKLRTKKWRLRVRYSKQVRKNRCHPFGTTKTSIKTKLRMPLRSSGAFLLYKYGVLKAAPIASLSCDNPFVWVAWRFQRGRAGVGRKRRRRKQPWYQAQYAGASGHYRCERHIRQ